MTPTLRRQRLVRLTRDGWASLVDEAVDAPRRDALTRWAAHDRPLVIASQARPPADGRIRLGLPLPGRVRLRVDVPVAALRETLDFPLAAAIDALLPRPVRDDWRALRAGLPADTRVYGSFGWQALTGETCVHDASDIDLLVPVATVDAADDASIRLHAWSRQTPRLDGELLLPDGRACAWREWRAWRSGEARALLVKGLHSARLVERVAALVPADVAEVPLPVRRPWRTAAA